MARVFISHASADTDVALRVEGWLTDAGHTVLLDRSVDRGIGLGEDWRPRLDAWLRAADAMVCLVTAAYATSRWSDYEIGAARARKCVLLPVIVEPGATHPQLESLHHIGLDDDERTRVAVLAALRTWPEDRSPFPGLAPFDRDRRRVFCGRSADVDDLVERLTAKAAGLIPVIGPSGCGKSSLVRAGLGPAMADTPGWLVLDPFTPGQDPVGELARAIALAWVPEPVLDVAGMRTRLVRDGLPEIARELLDAVGPSKRRLLVVVDQFEDIYGSKDRASFLDVLRSAADAPVQVVVTLRSSDLDLLLAEPDLAVAPPSVVRPLGRAALRAVILEPAKVAGLTVEEELVARLVDDTGDGDALPLLAYTLAELARGLGSGDTLSTERYVALDGVQGVVSRQAEAALDEARRATSRSRQGVLDGLLALVTADAQRAPTAARVDRNMLSPDDVAALSPFVERRLVTEDVDAGVVSYRVVHEMVLANWPPLREAVEAIRPGLAARERIDASTRDWVEAGRRVDGDELLSGDQLAAALVGVGATIDRRSPGSRPPFGEKGTLTAGPVPLSVDARAFLLASHRRDRRTRRRATTILTMLLVVSLIATGVTTALWWTTRDQQREAVARQLMAQADVVRAVDPTTALRLGLAAVTMHPGDDTRSALAEQVGTSHLAGTLADQPAMFNGAQFSMDGRTMVTEGTGGVAVWDATHRPPVRTAVLLPPEKDGYSTAAVSPDGRTVAAVTGARMTLWDVHDSTAARPVGQGIRLDGAQPVADGGDRSRLIFAPSGRVLAVARPGAVELFDVSEPAAAHLLGSPIVLDSPRLVAFGRSDRTLFTGVARPLPPIPTSPTDQRPREDTDDLVTWDLTEPAAPRPVGPRVPYSVAAVAAGRDLVAVASATGPRLTLWDYTDPRAPHGADIGPLAPAPVLLTFSSDGATLAAAGGLTDGHWLDVWGVAAPDRPHTLLEGWPTKSQRPAGAVTFPGVSQAYLLGGVPRVAVVTLDGRLSVYDYADGAVRNTGTMVDRSTDRDIVTVLPDGSAAIDSDGTLWDLTDRWSPVRLRTPSQPDLGVVADLAFAGRRTLAVASRLGEVDLIDLDRPDGPTAVHRVVPPLMRATLQLAFEPGPALSPRADLLAVVRHGADDDPGRVTVVDLHDPARPAPLPGPEAVGPNVSLRFTPNGLLTVLSGAGPPPDPGSLTLWDVADPRNPHVLGPPVWSGGLLAVARDNDLAVRFADDRLELIDLARAGKPPLGPSLPYSPRFRLRAALSPDGQTLVLSDGALWDLSVPSAPRELPVPLGPGAKGADVYVFSPDGRTLAVPAQGNRPGSDLELWNLLDRERPRALGPAALAPAGAVIRPHVAFSADGSTVASDTSDGIEAWDLTPLLALRAAPQPAACAVAVRGLDRAEWARYVGGEAYVDTCAA